jgi:penicillin V acylase-like amidase (Ntn superfamily)
MQIRVLSSLVFLVMILLPPLVRPCSMVLVEHCDGVVTGRTMDFNVDMNVHLATVPKGRVFGFGETRYNYVSFDSFGLPAHAINEKGLSVSLLWLNPTRYPDRLEPGRRYVNILEFAPLVLGTMESVGEVERFFETGDIDFVNIPEAVKARDLLHQHIYFVDAHGETLLIEWLDGRRYMYRNQTPVVVNDPPFPEQKRLWEEQLASRKDIVNWEYNLIGAKMHDADERYVMLRRLTEQARPTTGTQNTVKAFQLMARVEYMKIEPYLPGEVSWTLYTVVFSHTPDAVKVYYIDDTNSAVRLVDLARVDWRRGLSLPVAMGPDFIDMTACFAESPPEFCAEQAN